MTMEHPQKEASGATAATARSHSTTTTTTTAATAATATAAVVRRELLNHVQQRAHVAQKNKGDVVSYLGVLCLRKYASKSHVLVTCRRGQPRIDMLSN